MQTYKWLAICVILLASCQPISATKPQPSPSPTSVPTPTPIPAPTVTVAPSSTPVPNLIPVLEPGSTAFANQLIYSISDRVNFTTMMDIKHQNGLIYWISNYKKPFDIAGKVIESLQPAGNLPQEAIPNHTRFFPVFNVQGNGFFLWKEHDVEPAPGASPAPYTITLRPMKQFQAADPVTRLQGAVTAGSLDTNGDGSLYRTYDIGPDGMSLQGQNLWRYPVKSYQLQTTPELVMSTLPGEPVVETDGQGNGFVLWRKHLFADVNPPFDSGVIYLANYKPTGESIALSTGDSSKSAPRAEIQDGNGTIIIPVNEHPMRQWWIYPVRNYRVYPEEKHFLALPFPQPELISSHIQVSAEGNGLYVLVDTFREIRVRRIQNFQMVGPYYRLHQTKGHTADYGQSVENIGFTLDEQGDGILFWQEVEVFKNQLVETEPGVMNSKTIRRIYLRPIREFKTW